MFLLINTLLMFCLSMSYIISGWYQVYFRRREHALRKTLYLSKNVRCTSAVYLGRKQTFTAIFFVLWTGEFDTVSIWKTSERRMLQITPPTLKTSQFLRHRCCLTLNVADDANHSHFNRCQPRTVRKHKRRKVSLRVIASAERQQNRYGFTEWKHNKAYSVVAYSWFKHDWGQCNPSSKIDCRG